MLLVAFLFLITQNSPNLSNAHIMIFLLEYPTHKIKYYPSKLNHTLLYSLLKLAVHQAHPSVFKHDFFQIPTVTKMKNLKSKQCIFMSTKNRRKTCVLFPPLIGKYTKVDLNQQKLLQVKASFHLLRFTMHAVEPDIVQSLTLLLLL